MNERCDDLMRQYTTASVPSCCTYRAAVRTVLLYVPSCCTYRAAVRTVLLYVPSCCTYRLAVCTVLLYVPSCCTYRLAVRTVLLYVPCCCTYSSTVQRQVRLNPLQHKCYVMYRQFNSQQFYVLPTQCIGVFRINLRTNSSYFTVQH